jgi:hypothetical protein
MFIFMFLFNFIGFISFLLTPHKVTTLATFGSFDPQMVCTAHEHNARVVFGAGFSVDQLYNQTAVNEWIEAQYQVLTLHLISTSSHILCYC